MFLSPTELYELTGRKRRQAQVEALRTMGIEHRVRPDGFVLVLHAHVHKVFNGEQARITIKPVEPNWSALSAS